jgi:hypothetical protein
MGLVNDLEGRRVYLDTNVFLTNDRRLKGVSELPVVLLSEAVTT